MTCSKTQVRLISGLCANITYVLEHVVSLTSHRKIYFSVSPLTSLKTNTIKKSPSSVPSNFILHETKDWIAINKPAGMAVEGSKVGSPTVQSIVFDYLAAKEKKPYVGIVHRLDRVTTGVLLVAKKKSVLKALNELFRVRTIQKTYFALSDHQPSLQENTLEHHLFQDRETVSYTHLTLPTKA